MKNCPDCMTDENAVGEGVRCAAHEINRLRAELRRLSALPSALDEKLNFACKDRDEAQYQWKRWEGLARRAYSDGRRDALGCVPAALPEALSEISELRKQKDGAYSERNKLVAALSKIFPAWLEDHDAADKTWENDWRSIVFINLPAGQASWHLHDSELLMFAHLSRLCGNSWDGHTNDEKYARLAALTSSPSAPVEKAKPVPCGFPDRHFNASFPDSCPECPPPPKDPQ